jgi:pimeloyl-ACP methyl ester carboxylesterase
VIVFDHRCFGRSACSPENFSVASLAGDVLAVLDAEGVDKTAVIGHSMGGVTAMTLAARHGDRISRAAFCHTPGGLVTPEAATYVQ